MKIYLILLFFSFNVQCDFRNCTVDLQQIVYSLFDSIEAFEDDWSNPDSEPLKLLMKNVEFFLNDCLQKNIHIQKYNVCLDNSLPILRTIKQIIKDSKSKNAAGLIEDIVEVLVTVVSTASDCVKL